MKRQKISRRMQSTWEVKSGRDSMKAGMLGICGLKVWYKMWSHSPSKVCFSLTKLAYLSHMTWSRRFLKTCPSFQSQVLFTLFSYHHHQRPIPPPILPKLTSNTFALQSLSCSWGSTFLYSFYVALAWLTTSYGNNYYRQRTPWQQVPWKEDELESDSCAWIAASSPMTCVNLSTNYCFTLCIGFLPI